MEPESTDFNPCYDHYKVLGDSSSDGDDSDGDLSSRECIEESSYPLPVGTVCDHDTYK